MVHGFDRPVHERIVKVFILSLKFVISILILRLHKLVSRFCGNFKQSWKYIVELFVIHSDFSLALILELRVQAFEE